MKTAWMALAAAMTLSSGCATAPEASTSTVDVAFDYAGAEALLDVVERRSITDDEIARLLAVPGVRGMVRNVTRFFPEASDDDFRRSVQGWVERREPGERVYALRHIASGAAATRATLAAVKVRENELEQRVAAALGPFMPRGAPRTLTAYFVVGGVSDGFVLESDTKPAFYQAIDRAQGDVEGLALVAAHELYHVAQIVARKEVPSLDEKVGDRDTVPPAVRLLTVTLDEGTANLVADPTTTDAAGPYIQVFRDRYLHHRVPEHTAQDFALFDRLLADLEAGRITWSKAYEAGFSGGSAASNPLYFVGYEVAKTLNARYGPARIASAFAEHPAAFFLAYIELYQSGVKVSGRFAPETERTIGRLASASAAR